MGDVGSASLGFLAGSMPLLRPTPTLADAMIFGGLVSAPFLIDALVTLTQRALQKENLMQAHRSHQYQRLVSSGWSHRRVTLIYAAWALLCATCGLCWLANVPGKKILVIMVLVLPELSLAMLANILCKRSAGNPVQ
jgi:UDP-N-acetylmuramyl pentapeptide phosphotransferase/UDP-N-acetylglucosamine-1-phosphate transferase